MEEYLTTTVSKLKTNNYNELNLVLGNESCDLDSAVSALVYAAFLHWQYAQIKCKACTGKYRDETYKDDIYIPILDVERNDYPLKTEVSYCLRKNGINDSELIFRDDINIHQLLSKSKVNVILVDHHIVSGRYEDLSPYVIEIIDHRPVQNLTFKDVRSTLEIVGSCCTLVTQRIKDLAKLIKKDSDFFNMYPVTADLLHGAILLDTVNFSKEVNKATPHDEEIILYLERLLNLENVQQERASKLQQLVSARSDVSSLDASQLLRKDLKILGDILVPGFPILVKEFLQKPNAMPSVLAALQRSQCSLALLLGMDLKNGLRRDGAIVCADEKKGALLAKFLQDWSKPSFNLVPENEVGCLYFKQLNQQISRKQYMTVLSEFCDNIQYKDDIYIPILDVERNDYPLKTEVSYCLRKNGINDSELIFRDDINIHQLLSKSKVNVILVDHHIVSGRYEDLSPYVIEIIDHRPVQNLTFKDVRSTLEIVGSCCTLVTQRIKDLAKLIKKDSDFFNMYPVTADLLHGAILLDTVNFSKEVNKATPHDEEIILYLERLLNLENVQQERASKLQQLVSARSDVSSLDASQLLRKDLKILGDILVPGFPILVKEFLQKPNAMPSVLAALQRSQCSLALLLGMDLKNGLRRDGAIVCADEKKGALLAKFLQDWSKPSFNLVPENEVGCLYFKQLNQQISRKQYMTVLSEFVNNYKK